MKWLWVIIDRTGWLNQVIQEKGGNACSDIASNLWVGAWHVSWGSEWCCKPFDDNLHKVRHTIWNITISNKPKSISSCQWLKLLENSTIYQLTNIWETEWYLIPSVSKEKLKQFNACFMWDNGRKYIPTKTNEIHNNKQLLYWIQQSFIPPVRPKSI